MLFADQFYEHNVSHIPMIEGCAGLHSDPLVFLNERGEVVACNKLLSALFNANEIAALPPLEEWFEPRESSLDQILSVQGEYSGKICIADLEQDVAVRNTILRLGDTQAIGITFRDVTVIEKAKAAERYFDHFKKRFMTNISHEFRTPMNAIIGFTDLLKSSPMSTWQQEYAQLISNSALSMMRNIENLLELMQVESGNIHAEMGVYNPLEVYQDFSLQFYDLAEAKNLSLMFLLDPQFPKVIVGDQDKILTVLRNLVQNAIKFTSEGGQVLVEMSMVNKEADRVEVEYAVSGTGCGIEAERMKTLLRPFASAWENQRSGKDGLGIGLSLSHKYVDMMDSHLMLASQSGKGSRFSFRVIHKVEDAGTFDFIPGTHTAIYTPEPELLSQSALLHKYLQLFKVSVKRVEALADEAIHECDVLFVNAPHISVSQIEAIESAYPNIRVIPVMKVEYGEKIDDILAVSASVATLPILPTTLPKTLAVIWNTMPKEYVSLSPEVQATPTQNEIKILVAEDNLINLRLLETILRQQNFRVTAVDNGQKAVDVYLKENFDLVLMDIDMPVMDGLTANRLIKEIDKRDKRGYVPVIALTAHALIGDRERIVAAGLDAHLAKPIDKHFLLQTIDRYIKIAHQKKRENAV